MSDSCPSGYITALLHAGLLVSDLARAKVFYESVLGLKRIPDRPALPYPGEWYELGAGQQLHLMNLPNPDAASVARCGCRRCGWSSWCGSWISTAA